MSNEEARNFEKELSEAIGKMTARLTDKPRYQLSGEIIPESLLKEGRQNQQESGH